MESQPPNPEFRINPEKLSPMPTVYSTFSKIYPFSENSVDSDQVALDEAGRTDPCRL